VSSHNESFAVIDVEILFFSQFEILDCSTVYDL
jgi:hypothetical protein